MSVHDPHLKSVLSVYGYDMMFMTMINTVYDVLMLDLDSSWKLHPGE